MFLKETMAYDRCLFRLALFGELRHWGVVALILWVHSVSA